MTRSAFLSAILMAISAVAAFAADVTGTWSGQMAGPNGDGFQIAFTFKQEGAKLTGSVAGPGGDPLPISDGKVEGEKLFFTVSFNGMIIKHDGTISGDEIKLSSKADQGQFPGGTMTLKRAK